MSHPTVNQRAAVRLLQDAFNFVVETQQDNIAAAAALIVASMESGGIIQVFGTGHSRASRWRSRGAPAASSRPTRSR